MKWWIWTLIGIGGIGLFVGGVILMANVSAELFVDIVAHFFGYQRKKK